MLRMNVGGSVIAEHFSGRRVVQRMSVAMLAACGTGLACGLLRPMFSGPIHYEALISLFGLLPAICLGLVWSMRRLPWRRATAWLVAGIALSCIGFGIFMMIGVQRFLWDDVMRVMAVYAVVASLVGWLLLFVIQMVQRPTAGPYCPACAYCLIGAREDRCPECGRAFTLDELGIGREELTLHTDSC